jgi:type IV secretory pathway component VirB8
MEKEENNANSGNFREIIALLKNALAIYVNEGQERRREQEEYELYREQYPFEEYYQFKEEFKCKWE